MPFVDARELAQLPKLLPHKPSGDGWLPVGPTISSELGAGRSTKRFICAETNRSDLQRDERMDGKRLGLGRLILGFVSVFFNHGKI